MNKLRINYKEGGFSLIWFDKELQRLQMMTTGEAKGKTILDIKEQKEFEDIIGVEFKEAKPFTFQAYLEQLNNSEPKSDFALWKAMDLAKFVRTHMYKEYHNKFGWCSYPFENEPLGYCWSFALWVDKNLIVAGKKIETKEDLWKFCNEGCDCFNGKGL